jgi:hypothetical protein
MKIKVFDPDLTITDSKYKGNFKYIRLMDNDEASMLKKGFLPSHHVNSFALSADFSICEALYRTWLPPPSPPLNPPTIL